MKCENMNFLFFYVNLVNCVINILHYFYIIYYLKYDIIVYRLKFKYSL